jgi:hypothetical protein
MWRRLGLRSSRATSTISSGWSALQAYSGKNLLYGSVATSAGEMQLT